MKSTRRGFTVLAITLALFLQACNPNFGGQLRTVFNVSDVFLNSLNLGEHRAAVARDFTDLGRRAADLSDDLSNCHDKACNLEAVNRFQVAFFDIERRGHFGLHPTLRKIESLIKGVIEAARIYYTPGKSRDVSTDSDKAADLKSRIAELKAAMKAK